MSSTKHGLSAVGVCLVAALGLMVLSAAAAQATTGWLVNKAFITKTQSINASVHPLPGTLVKHVAFSSEPLGVKTEILCGSLSADDGLLVANEKAEGSASLLLTECRTFIFEEGKFKESKVCAPSEPITFGVKFHAILHPSGEKKTYLLFEPPVLGGAFVEIKYPNEECVFNPRETIAGSFVMECLNEKLEKNTSTTDYCLEDLVHHLIQEAPNQKTLFGDGLVFAGRPMTLGGIIDMTQIELKTWAVHAPILAEQKWLVEKLFITKAENVHAAIHPLPITLEKHMVLSGEPLGTKTEILCGNLVVDDGLIFSGEKAEGLGTLLFTKCTTFLLKEGISKESTVCKPGEPIEAKVKAHAFLHSTGDKKTYVLFEPDETSRPIAEIKFFNEECVFSPSQAVAGSLVAECLNEKLEKNTSTTDYCLEDLAHHLIQEAPNQKTLFGDGLTFGARPAGLGGIADVLQSESKPWAVHV